MQQRLTLAAIAVATLFTPPLAAVAQPDEGTIVVTATRQPTRANELLNDVTVLTQDDIERSGQTSVAELLARQPGIQFSTTGGPGTSTSLYVRGSRSDQTKVLVDGVPINSIDLAGSPLRFLSMDDVERIEILRGPASSLYGADAIGGVIQVFTKRPAQGLAVNAFAGYGTYDTRKLNGGIAGGNELIKFRVNADELRTAGFSAKKNASNRDADDDGYSSSNRSVAVSLTPAKGHEIGLSARHGKGTVHYDDSSGSGNFDDRNDFETDTFSLFSRNRWTRDFSTEVRVGESNDDQTGYSSFGPLQLTTRNRLVAVQGDFRTALGKALLAVERNDIKVGPTSAFLADPKLSTKGAVAGFNGAVDRHRFQVSARRDDNDTFGAKTTGAASYGFSFDDRWRAHVGVASSFKAPTAYQLFDPFAGTLTLKPEEGRNREAGLNYETTARRFSLVAFENRVRNLIDYDFTTFNYQNVGRAVFRGVTTHYDARIGATHFATTLEGLRAYNEDTGKKLGRRAERTALFVADHQFGALTLGGEMKLASSRYSLNDESGRMGGYTLLALTAKYAIGKEWAIELRGDNLGDKEYELAQGYNTAGRSFFAGVRYQGK